MLKEVNYEEWTNYELFEEFDDIVFDVYKRIQKDIPHFKVDIDKLKYALCGITLAYKLSAKQLSFLCLCNKELFIRDIQNIYNRIPVTLENICKRDYKGFVPECCGSIGLLNKPEWMLKQIYIDDGILYPVYSDKEFSVHMFTNVGHKITENKTFYSIRNIELRAMYKLHEECNENGRADECFDFESLKISNSTDFKILTKEEARSHYQKNKTLADFVSGEFLTFLDLDNSSKEQYKAPKRDAVVESRDVGSVERVQEMRQSRK